MNQRQTGYVRIRLEEYDQLKDAFTSEGFDSTILQVWKEGQLWGGAKLLNSNNELHVRILLVQDFFSNFLVVKPEIEVPRDYLEHLSSDFLHEPYHGPVLEILCRHAIPYEIVGNLPADPIMVKRPTQPTPWKPLASVIGIGAFLWFMDELGKGFM
jgi:hypothetical protein